MNYTRVDERTTPVPAQWAGGSGRTRIREEGEDQGKRIAVRERPGALPSQARRNRQCGCSFLHIRRIPRTFGEDAWKLLEGGLKFFVTTSRSLRGRELREEDAPLTIRPVDTKVQIPRYLEPNVASQVSKRPRSACPTDGRVFSIALFHTAIRDANDAVSCKRSKVVSASKSMRNICQLHTSAKSLMYTVGACKSPSLCMT